MWRQGLNRAAGQADSRRAAATVGQHLTVAGVALARGARDRLEHRKDAVLAEGRRVLISDPTRFDEVQVIAVDEHVWRHTRRGDKRLFTDEGVAVV